MSTQENRRSSRDSTRLRSRRPRSLGTKLEKRLAAYSAAAGAAAGVLGLATPAHATIIYTPANQVLIGYGGFSIDLNHDGTPDIEVFIAQSGIRTGNYFLDASGRHPGDGLLVNTVARVTQFGQTLKSGVQIGPIRQFHDYAVLAFFNQTTGYHYGPWFNVK